MLVLNPYPQTPFPGKGAILETNILKVVQPIPFPRERGYITGATAPDQARMLAVSHTKPLHDAVAQMADDLYGGYAPATPFLYNQEVYRQSDGRL